MEQSAYPVDVIAMYTAAGEIQPLRLRVEDPAKGCMRVNIDRIISVRQIHYVGVEAQIFLCRGSAEGRSWTFELKYSIRSHSWSLYSKVWGPGGARALPVESAWGNYRGKPGADVL